MFEIGNTLREARLRKGLDISECELATKIRPKYLRALEDEHFDLLPSPAYIRGFLRSYAEFLDLDGQLVIDEYESRFGAFDGADTRRPAESASIRRTAPGRPRSESAGRRRAPARRGGTRRPSRRRTEAQLLWLAIGGVLAVGLLVQMGVGDPNEGTREITIAGAGTVTASPPGTEDQDPRLATAERPEAVRILLSGTGADGSYVEVRAKNAAGREVYRAILLPGQTKSFAVDRSIWLRAANTAGLELKVNDKVYPLSGGTADFLVSRQGPRAAGNG
ncbi:MAG: helix-turn-helix domain-containing protein [Thermoleophilia bacterium]|nr:helix-turn-helix domain-containing protein [Thermoleophilia bacterium]